MKPLTGRDWLPYLLVGLCLALYLPAFGWGVPHPTGADRTHAWGNDDQVPLMPLSEMYNTFVEADPNRNVAYPWFHYFLVASVYAPYILYLVLTGGLELAGSAYPFGLRDPAGAFAVLTVLGRSVSLALAIAAVLAIYDAGKNLWGRRAGLAAGVATALMFPLSYYARTGNLDAPVLGWTCLGIAAVVRWLCLGPTLRRAAAVGLFVALAVSTKEQAVGSFLFLVPSLFVVHVRQSIRERAGLRQAIAPLAAATAAFAAGYVLAQGIPVDPARYTAHMAKVVGVGTNTVALYNRYPATLAGYGAQAADLVHHLGEVMTWPLVLLSAWGIIMAVAAPDRRPLLLALSSAGLFLLLMPVRFSRLHYLLGVAAPLNLFAGLAVARLAEWRTPWRRLAPAGAALIALYLLLQSVDLTHAMLFDARYGAGDWLARESRAGDRVLYFGANLKLPALPPNVETVQVEFRNQARQIIRATRPEYVLTLPEDTDEDRMRVEWRVGPHSVYNGYLPDDVYEELVNGALGYRLVAQYQTPRLLPWISRPFLSYATVNPPVQIFARTDRVTGVPVLSAWRTAPHNPPFYRRNEPPTAERNPIEAGPASASR